MTPPGFWGVPGASAPSCHPGAVARCVPIPCHVPNTGIPGGAPPRSPSCVPTAAPGSPPTRARGLGGTPTSRTPTPCARHGQGGAQQPSPPTHPRTKNFAPRPPRPLSIPLPSPSRAGPCRAGPGGAHGGAGAGTGVSGSGAGGSAGGQRGSPGTPSGNAAAGPPPRPLPPARHPRGTPRGDEDGAPGVGGRVEGRRPGVGRGWWGWGGRSGVGWEGRGGLGGVNPSIPGPASPPAPWRGWSTCPLCPQIGGSLPLPRSQPRRQGDGHRLPSRLRRLGSTPGRTSPWYVPCRDWRCEPWGTGGVTRGPPGSGLTLRPASFAESSQSATAGAAAEPRVSQRCAGRGRRRWGQWGNRGAKCGHPQRGGSGRSRWRPGGSSLSPLCPVQVPVSPSPTPMSATARPSGTRGRRSSGCA